MIYSYSFLSRLLSLLTGIFIGSAVFIIYPNLFGIQPYSKVNVYEETWTDEGLTVRASFLKNGQCAIISFSVLVFVDKVPRYVPYEDLDGLPVDFDREEGRQGLNIFVPIDPKDVDFVELRTRHRCLIDDEGNTKVVTKVFTRHEST